MKRLRCAILFISLLVMAPRAIPAGVPSLGEGPGGFGDRNPGINLLSNPGFEKGGEGMPHNWTPLTLKGGTGVPVYTWESVRPNRGDYSVRIENHGSGAGMWQQIVPVVPGRVYSLKGYVGFEDIVAPGQCRLQVVFRDPKGRTLDFVDLPGHDGTRAFEPDFPHSLKFRSPEGAARAEINCLLLGPGTAWFDDIFFGPVPTGEITGMVTCEGQAVEGALVRLLADPWEWVYEAFTDEEGRYLIEDVPVAFPRYVMTAEKEGFRSRPRGDVAVRPDQATRVDFPLIQGRNPLDLLLVKFACMELNYHAAPAIVPPDAVIPLRMDGYPESVREYLKSDAAIDPDDPAIVGLADKILRALDPQDRNDTYKVAWAVYQWVAKHIGHDSVFGGADSPFLDVTSGIYQTILDGGWAWGANFHQWCYRPAETLKMKTAICVEHAWLGAALLRALHIPARTVSGSVQFWVQKPDEYGYWVGLSTSAGSNAYRESGVLGPGFGGMEFPVSFPVTSRPMLHVDWTMEKKCLWHERHPWSETYPATDEGLALAMDHLERFMKTGSPSKGLSCPIGSDRYRIHYRQITIDLQNVDGDPVVDVRFPMVSESDTHHGMDTWAFWSNHPECLERTYIEETVNPPVQGVERWFHMVFDLTSLVRPLELTW